MGYKEVHDLQTDHECFKKVAEGCKKFELRKFDRNFKIGDILMLGDFYKGIYQNCFMLAVVEYILKDYKGLEHGYAILSIKPISGIVTDLWGYFE